MPRSCSPRRVPRAHVDPITSAEAALAVFALARHDPPRPETLVVLLDHQRRGVSIVVVADTCHPDAVVDVVEVVADAATELSHVGGLIVASVRPDGRVLDGDVDRWLEASDCCDDRGIELVEWLVLGDVVACPRDLFGEAPRWVP